MPLTKLEELQLREQLDAGGLSKPEELNLREALDSGEVPTSIPEVPEGGFSTFEQLIEQAKSFGTELLAESPIIAGATGGAVIGGGAGGPPGAIAGAIGGGTVGALSKEAVEQMFLRLGVIEEGDKLISDIPIQKRTIGESAQEAGIAGITMGIGEATGQVLLAPLAKLARGASRSVTPEGREALEFFKAHPDANVVPNPAKVTDSRILDIASNAGEASIFSGNKFLQGQIKATEFIDDTINQLVNKSSLSKEALGDLLEFSINKRVDALRSAANTLFGRIDDIAGEQFVNAAPFINSVRSFKGEVKRTIKSKPLASILDDLEITGRTFIDKSGNQVTGMTFSEAQRLRSALLQIERQGADALPDRTIGIIKNLEGKLEAQMGIAANKAGPDVLKQFRKANEFWKQGKRTFNDRIIKGVLTKDPDVAIDQILSATKDRAVLIRRIKSAIGDKEVISQVEDAALKRIIFKATNPQTGELTSKSILNQLKTFGGADGKALKAMFPKGQDKVLARLARIKGVVMTAQPDATGRLAVQIGQLAAIGGLATGTFPVSSAFLLIFPEAIARAFRSPRIVKFITEGAKARPGLKGGVTFISRLAALLSKEKIPFELQQPEKGVSEVPAGLFQ